MTWILIALACARPGDPSFSKTDDGPMATPGSPTQTATEAPIPPAPTPVPGEEKASTGTEDLALESCMTECEQANQMRAVAAEVISADCMASCTGTPPTLGTEPFPPAPSPP